MSAAAPAGLDARTFLRAAVFHYGRLAGNGYAAQRAVARALDARPGERVLDVGCGTGGFCVAVPGQYVGIDLDADYVAFARWRWGNASRRFEVARLDALDAEKGFDGAMLVNALHHMSDVDARAVLASLVHLVRRRLVVVDADPEPSNAFQALLLRYDRGDYIRPRRAQRALIQEHFRVVDEGQFRNSPRTLVQTLFACEPRR
jgi:SAM-dependent methyltransferase